MLVSVGDRITRSLKQVCSHVLEKIKTLEEAFHLLT